MKTLVIYDSMYGNTEKIARAIGSAVPGEVKVLNVKEADPSEAESVGLLIVGAPTQGGRATPAVQSFIDKLDKAAIKGISAAAFDTRVPAKWVKIFGFAAGRIARSLKGKGANLVAAPEGFFVNGKEGPLVEGELERAAGWAKEISGC